MGDILIPAVDLSLAKGSIYKFRETSKPHSIGFVHQSLLDSKSKRECGLGCGVKDVGKTEFQFFKDSILSFVSMLFNSNNEALNINI